MASITEHILKLQELTQTNLDILKSINDSFFSKQDHLSINVGENKYALPSFINLENKINLLASNFENLINAPESGEAFFNMDGNSRSIQVRSYTSTPNSLTLPNIENFEFESNNKFKDFVTPRPYVKISTKSLPNDITNVVVKKIIPTNPILIEYFKSQLTKDDKDLTSNSYAYKDLYKILSQYTIEKDYIEYDTKVDLPIRKNIGSGTYVIENIIEDVIDENLDNYIKIKFRNDISDSNYMNSLKYRLFDETIEKSLKVGDQLVTYEGNAKMEIVEIYPNSNIVRIKVLHGEYLNLFPSSTNDISKISPLSKIRFYSPIDFDEDKFVKVTLEEDQYIFIAIAALNDRMNVQSSWGNGLILNTYNLINNNIKFEEYYKKNVNNIGDILLEISSMMTNTLTQFDESEFNSLVQYKPVIDQNNLLVLQINKHLNNSIAVQNIRSMYSQKKELQSKLKDIQNEIDNINNILANTSFDDTTGIRISYTNQLNLLITERNTLSMSISKLLDDIALAANNSEVPIENAKYRIRGFFDLSSLTEKEHIRGIRVQYRYKNVDQEQGSAHTIGEKFIFSDWICMNGFDREKIPTYNNGYKFSIETLNDDVNEPSFNQIDIPISQGETVDIRLKVVYDYGWPFVNTSSQWSNIINISFPEEYLKDVQILDIISENNNEIETYRFNNIIKEEGIPDHVGDRIIDQDITYYHKPENIASGFYTSERRIIPLKDKLITINDTLMSLMDEIQSGSESLNVSIKHGHTLVKLNPYQIHNVNVEAYNALKSSTESAPILYKDLYAIKGDWVTTVLNISITNTSNHNIKLYSIFPGNREVLLSKLTTTGKGIKGDYYFNTNQEIYFKRPIKDNNDSGVSSQGANQFIYFRWKDINDGAQYYGEENDLQLPFGTQVSYEDYTTTPNKKSYMYPKLHNRYGLCIDSDVIGSYLSIAPNTEILIPIVFEYNLTEGAEGENQGENQTTNKTNQTTNKTMSFDILTSLYKEPITYTFRVNAKQSLEPSEKVIETQKNNYSKSQTEVAWSGTIYA